MTASLYKAQSMVVQLAASCYIDRTATLVSDIGIDGHIFLACFIS